MTYRPQFACPPAHPGFEYEDFAYYFDGTNTPLLSAAQALASGVYVENILLPLEADADFIARGLKIQLGTAPSDLWFKLKTPRGDYLQSVYVPSSRYANGTGAALAGKLPAPFEDSIFCPKASVWTLYLYNPRLVTVNPPAVTIYGQKVWDCRKKRAA